MDPIGFGFENSTASRLAGERWKASLINFGRFGHGESFKGPAELRRYCLSKKEPIRPVPVGKDAHLRLGRGLEYYDRCAIDQNFKDLAKKNYRFLSLSPVVKSTFPNAARRTG